MDLMDLVVRHGQREEQVHLERTEHGYRVTLDGRTYEVDVAAVSGSVQSLIIAGRQHEVAVHGLGNGRYRVANASGTEELELMDPLTHLARASHDRSRSAGSAQVTAYMPGRVVKLLVAAGDEVAAGQGVVVLEAMKMENEICAEHAGVVSKILVETGQAVEGGDPLFELT